MSEPIVDPLEVAIRNAGEGWLIDWYSPREKAIPVLRRILNEANDWGKHRYGASAPDLSPEAIIAEYAENPRRVRAFLQVVPSVGSPPFLVLVWRILQGMDIAAIKLEYEKDKPFRLSVRLESPYGDIEEYESNDIDDAVILRHLGTMKMGHEGVFDGFYALNVG